jgi:hypothetical protein
MNISKGELMKKKYLSLLFMFLTPLVFAQSAQQVPVPAADKLAIEKDLASLQTFQAQAAAAQTAYNANMASLKWQFSVLNTDLIAKEDSLKKRLGLPVDATFDPTTFSFTIPAKPASPPAKPASPPSGAAPATPAPSK